MLRFDLRKATVEQFARALFDHPASDDPSEPWYFDNVEFATDSERQLRLMTERFQGAPAIFSDYSSQQVEAGL